jgi:putative flippase GtrA
MGRPPLAAKLMGIAIAFIVNFLGNLCIVFHTSRRARWRGACDPRMVSHAVATAVPCQFAFGRTKAFTIYRLAIVLRFCRTRSYP